MRGTRRSITLVVTFALLAWVLGCRTTEGATEVVVLLRADSRVSSGVRQVRVTVEGFAAGATVSTSSVTNVYMPAFPEGATVRRIAIVPAGGDASRTFSVNAEAIGRTVAGEDISLSTARLRSGFLVHRTIELSLLLVSGCACPPGKTCNAEGRCVDEVINPSMDGGVGPGTDAGAGDGGTDAGLPPSCVGTGACDDRNPCTVGDTCAAGVCTPGSTRLACTDTNPCDGTDACVDFVGCVAGPMLNCDDGVGCTIDTCAPVTGCSNVPDNTRCTEMPGGTCARSTGCRYLGCTGCATDACNTRTCDEGMCEVTSRCDDGRPCTMDSCASGACANTPITGPACDDGDACTVNDACRDGACGGDVMVCPDDGEQCTGEICTAGACASYALSDFSACTLPPGVCGIGPRCISGVCTAGTGGMVCASCDVKTGMCL